MVCRTARTTDGSAVGRGRIAAVCPGARAADGSALPVMAAARMANREVTRPVVVVTVLGRAHMAMRAVGLAVVDRVAHEGPATTLSDR